MSDLRLRERSATELVDASFLLYRHGFVRFVTVFALFHAPLLLLELLVPALRPTLRDGQAMTPALGLMTVVGWIVLFGASAVVMRLGSRIYLGEEAEIGTAAQETLPRIPAMVLASALQGLVIGMWAVLLIVGSFYAAARWFAVPTLVVLEDKGPIEAFGRSTQLSTGRKRHILNTLLLGLLIYSILILGVTALATTLESTAIQIILITVVAIIGRPFIALLAMMLYYDTRIRGEAFDLERMAGALDAPLTAAP